MRLNPRYALICAGLVAAIALAACQDTPAPRSQEGFGGGQRDIIEAKAAPEVQEGVVPDVINVSAGDAAKAVKEAGYKPVFDPLGLSFASKEDKAPNEALICEQDPEGGATPPTGVAGKKTTVELTFDRLKKC